MFEHRKMRSATLKFQDKSNPTPVEKELEKIVSAFAKLQEDRYKAGGFVRFRGFRGQGFVRVSWTDGPGTLEE
jgi:hypothetical protein